MPAYSLPRRFAEEDRRLFSEANTGVSLPGARDVVEIEDCCGCTCR